MFDVGEGSFVIHEYTNITIFITNFEHIWVWFIKKLFAIKESTPATVVNLYYGKKGW